MALEIGSRVGPYQITFSPDGKLLAFTQVTGFSQIWTMPIAVGNGLKGGTPERYVSSQFADATPTISPDGRWLAYVSTETGREEVVVRTFPASGGQGGKWQISNNGGASPMWMPGGREILYRSGDQIISVGYTATGDSFAPQKPRVWLASLGGALGVDLAPDGKRLLMLTAASGSAPHAERTLIFVQNFFDELRRRVPIGK
jgi:serine/threonine-protein kinase